MATEAWTRKEGKNPEGGLNEKGRKSYKRGNLKAPSKVVGNKRGLVFVHVWVAWRKNLLQRKLPMILTVELIKHWEHGIVKQIKKGSY